MSNDGIQTDNSVKYIRYTPNQQGFGHNSGAGQRIIRISQTPQDPLEQPKFKHKRIPGALNEEPVPVMHSLSKKITREDQLAWNIPPCVSNWKNAKGFTIPLEMRLSADGRNLKNVINNFLSFFKILNKYFVNFSFPSLKNFRNLLMFYILLKNKQEKK